MHDSIQIKHTCNATAILRDYLLIKVSFFLPVQGSLPALQRCAHHSLPKARPCSACILPLPLGVEAVVIIGNTLTLACLILLSRTSSRSTWTLCTTERPTWQGHSIRGFLLPIWWSNRNPLTTLTNLVRESKHRWHSELICFEVVSHLLPFPEKSNHISPLM